MIANNIAAQNNKNRSNPRIEIVLLRIIIPVWIVASLVAQAFECNQFSIDLATSHLLDYVV